jgi:hypothetical protein
VGGLYELSTDPSEDHDVSQTSVQARDAMTARLSAWLKRNPAAKPAEGDAPTLEGEALDQLRALGYAD